MTSPLALRLFSMNFFVVVCLTLSTNLVWGKVLHSREEALQLAFPDAERTETRRLTLTEEEQKRVVTLATTPLDTKQFTFYTGYKDGQLLGYAFVQTLTVRTLPGTFLVVVSPTGVVQKVMALAFHEPEDYLPTERWMQQFEQKMLGPDVQLRQGIHSIAGATLSSQAVTNAVRLSLALFQFLTQERQ
jgi:Na+-translocating ferredoxin:NAD+ oxidoreductase RnfG subunit